MSGEARTPSPELRVCGLVREAVGWDRVVVVVARDVDTRAALRGSDPVLEGYCDLQQTLLQGPSLDAFTSGAPVVVDDLRARLPWPLLSSATPPDLPVRSLAVVPLLHPTGGGTPAAQRAVPPGPVLGVLIAGRDDLTPFTPAQVAVLVHLAGVVAAVLVHRAGTGELLAVDPDPNDDLAVVAGMVAEHLGSSAGAPASAGEALSRMRAHAFTTGRTLNQLARAVLAGEVAVADVAHPR